jgi:1,4-alpha-glucan branching enzyme
MQLLPLNKLGAFQKSAQELAFGLFLPWIRPEEGNKLFLKIIHEEDQFKQDIQPQRFALNYQFDEAYPTYGDYWSVTINLDPADRLTLASAWGKPGRYVYRYELENERQKRRIDWIIDPFAREFGIGQLSAITLGYEPFTWDQELEEKNWRTPPLTDLVIYELMINEFAADIDRTIDLFYYLADLGVNCLEIMPVSNVSQVVDWGFLPIGYFGVDERFGKRKNMQQLIQAAHSHGLAVIMDSVYGHASDSFTYQYVYDKMGFAENPFMGSFAKDYFGKSTDFQREFTQDFFYTVNYHWLDCYHVDGFRYDCVPNYYAGAAGPGYAELVYETYQLVRQKAAENGHWQRFAGKQTGTIPTGAILTFIQCAEQLEAPLEIVEKTYSNCTWQNETLGAAQQVAQGNRDGITSLGLRLGLVDYPSLVKNQTDVIPKSALQYIENHDHQRFVCNFRTILRDNILLQEGDRSLWYKVQPYLIGLLTSKGIPLLWQGQELGENYYIPHEGWGRVMLFRPVRWDYFYDPIGRSVISLVRRLLRLRKTESQFRNGEHYFYNHYERYQSKQILIYHRQWEDTFSLIALNFSDQDQWVPFEFQLPGVYREGLHEQDNFTINTPGEQRWLLIPGNYGKIWTNAG